MALNGNTLYYEKPKIYDHPRVYEVSLEPQSEPLSVEELITNTFPEEPELALRIAKCESNLDPNAYNENNSNGSVDRGLMQLNSIHDKRLNELGLDPWSVEDNLAYARILYEESGWKPWVCTRLLAQN